MILPALVMTITKLPSTLRIAKALNHGKAGVLRRVQKKFSSKGTGSVWIGAFRADYDMQRGFEASGCSYKEGYAYLPVRELGLKGCTLKSGATWGYLITVYEVP